MKVFGTVPIDLIEVYKESDVEDYIGESIAILFCFLIQNL